MSIKEKMFLETDEQRAKKIREYLEENNISYKEKSIHELIHFDVENLSDSQAIELKKMYKQLDAPIIEKRHRKWDEKFHTVGEEFMGEFTGKNREEEVEYGRE